jgi:NAD(P)H-flavin reductase
MTLVGRSKIYKHRKTTTLYLSIPSMMVCDSTFNFKAGEYVIVENHSNYLIIKKGCPSNDSTSTNHSKESSK